MNFKSSHKVVGFALSGGLLFVAPLASAAKPTIQLFATPAALTKHCDAALRQAKAEVVKLESPRWLKAASDARIGQIHQLAMLSGRVGGNAYLLSNVHPDDAMRDAGEKCYLQFSEFESAQGQNEKLFALTQSITPANPIQAKLKQDLLYAFQDSGVSLPPDKRKRALEIAKKTEELNAEFGRNIRDDKTSVAMTEEQVKGVPESMKSRLKKDDQGRYLVTLDGPDYQPFMSNSESGEARQKLQLAYTQRGGERNLGVLKELVALRQELAQLHGVPTYADLVIRRRMAQSPQAVDEFLQKVKDKVQAKEREEIAQLRAEKASFLNQPLDATKFERWDLGFYQERLQKARSGIDQESLRSYFPTEASLQWVLGVAKQLYGIEFKEVKSPVWHSDVRMLQVYDQGGSKTGATNGEFLGAIYIDLFPRAGKYSHAAVFPFLSSSRLAKQTSLGALVTNFDRKGLTHDELETMVHEFGHALHGVLSKALYVQHAGTSVEQDFVEAPSQMFEAWAQRPESLSTLASYCKPACPVADAKLIKQLKDAKRFGKAIQYSRQHLYASYDLKLTRGANVDPLQAWVDLESATPLGYVPGSRFPGQFGHLAGGYAAGYYGYMWSEVLGLDMLSRFGTNLMDPAIGKVYRQTILARGGEVTGMQMVREFLGREPNPEAFFAEITGTGQ